jgi:hypothetical protein
MIINPRWGRQIQYDPTALLAVQSAGAIAQVAGGIGGVGAANQEADLQRQQGQIALQESQVNANNAAFNETQAVQNQRLAFLANGVSLEGSPSLVLAASKSYAQTQVQSILDQGAAQYNLAQREAAITQNKGRAALIADVAQGVGTEATGVQKFIQAGGGSGTGVRPGPESIQG